MHRGDRQTIDRLRRSFQLYWSSMQAFVRKHHMLEGLYLWFAVTGIVYLLTLVTIGVKYGS